jgi:tellurite resistance protein
VLLILGWLYAAQCPRRVLADLRDPVLAPFVAVPAITAMMLAAALASVDFAAGRALVVIFLAVTVGVGGWLPGGSSAILTRHRCTRAITCRPSPAAWWA